MKSRFWLGVLLLLSLIPLRSFFWMEDWLTHDLQGYEVRLAALSLAMEDGEWLGRWISTLDCGYGYPLFRYYAPGFYLFAALFHQLGLAIMPSIKIAIVVFQCVGAMGMFGLCRLFYAVPVSAICALAWAFLPYQQVNLFVRGSVAEFAALQLLVVALCFFLRHARYGRFRDGMLGALFLAMMIVTHAITALLGTALVLAISTGFAFHWQRPSGFRGQAKVLFRILILLAWGILLSSFYWLPALAETHYVRTGAMSGSGLHYSQHFLEWPQWFNVTYWGFGPSVDGPNDGMAFHVGLVPLMLVILGWWLAIKQRQQPSAALVVGTGGAFVLLFLTHKISIILWNTLPLMAYIQFPWRLLGEVGILMCMASGAGLEAALPARPLERQRTVIFSALLLVILAPPWYWLPTLERNVIVSSRPSKDEIRSKTWALTGVDEFLPKDVREKFPEEYPAGSMRRTADDAIIYGGYWFPGVEVWVDDKLTPSSPSDRYGLIEFQSKNMNPVIRVRRGRTPLQQVADSLSVFGFALWLILFAITQFFPFFRFSGRRWFAPDNNP